jgi:hypothetical protein
MDSSNTPSRYAIVIKKTEAILELFKSEFDGKIELHAGTLVEIEKHSFNSQYCTILVHDFHQKNIAYENNLYSIKRDALLQVSEQIWPFLIAITNPVDRVNLAGDEAYVNYLLRLTVRSFVPVLGKFFYKNPIRQSLQFQFLPEREPKEQEDYNCIIRYIGPVVEIGPGFFFGFELLVMID